MSAGDTLTAMRVSELGEFGLIERLRAALPATADGLVAGIGDDAAAWRAPAASLALATTDTMVAGVHFLPGRVSWEDAGWKAVAVNVSDVAAMGGTPSFALVTLCLPPGALVEDIDALYRGVLTCAEAYGVTVAGGDIVSAPVFAITVALYGASALDDAGAPVLLRRDAARAGDAIAVTGALGGSAGGLRALLRGDAGAHADALIARHMRPAPRVDVAQAAVAAGARCAIDISDGLMQDIGHICAASNVGADIEAARLPVDADLLAAYPDDALLMVAAGGEDYELALIAPNDVLARVASPLVIIGHITAGPGVRLLDAAGAPIDVSRAGWDHLRPAEEA